MNTILVLAHQDDGQLARLQVALDLARALDGHLGCMDGIVPAAPAGPAYGHFAATERVVADCLRKTANEARIKARLAREGVAWNWIDGAGFVGESLAIVSDLADLVVVSVGAGKHEPPELRRLARHLTLWRNRPVLAVPHDFTGLDPTGTVLVAWDRSCRPEEAWHDALPLLRLAREVVLLDIDGQGGSPLTGRFAFAAAVHYFAGHGIHAKAAPQGRRNPGVCAAILDKAHDLDASYIVMGAYDDSLADLRGTIGAMLANSDLPLFIARR